MQPDGGRACDRQVDMMREREILEAKVRDDGVHRFREIVRIRHRADKANERLDRGPIHWSNPRRAAGQVASVPGRGLSHIMAGDGASIRSATSQLRGCYPWGTCFVTHFLYRFGRNFRHLEGFASP